MGIAVYEFTPDQAKDLVGGAGESGIVDVLEDISGVKGLTSYMVGGNLYVVVAT